MKKTNKLKALVLAELDGLKALLPLEVRKATLVWESYNPQCGESCIYGLLNGAHSSPITCWIKNFVATPYSYDTDYYKRCRAKSFAYDWNDYIYSALEYYIAQLDEDDKIHAQIFAYLLEETNKISL